MNLTPVEENTERKKAIATWNIELNCQCPHCDEWVDLLDCPDFWDGRHFLEPAMQAAHHDQAAGLHENCPNCGKPLEFDCEY